LWRFVALYSGATVPDFHGVPFYLIAKRGGPNAATAISKNGIDSGPFAVFAKKKVRPKKGDAANGNSYVTWARSYGILSQ
jgi:hypothetical protein